MKSIVTQKPAVLITAIVCGTVLCLGLLTVVGWLLYWQRDTSTILTLVNLFLTAFLFKRVGDVDTRAAQIERHVNGTNTKLVDAVLQSPPIGRD